MPDLFSKAALHTFKCSKLFDLLRLHLLIMAEGDDAEGIQDRVVPILRNRKGIIEIVAYKHVKRRTVRPLPDVLGLEIIRISQSIVKYRNVGLDMLEMLIISTRR